MEDNISSFHKLSDFHLQRPSLSTGYVPIAVDEGLLGCFAALLGEWFLAFEMVVMVPSPSGSSRLRRQRKRWTIETSPSNTVPHPRKTESLATCYETHKSHTAHC
jgi:hypothetical protein